VSVDAVVMAAGEGRRLRPLTERWAKPVLPLDGEPVLVHLLRDLAEAAAVRRVWVVTGHHAEQVEALAGDGSAFGLELRTVRQPRADGSADAVRRALAAGAQPPLLVCAADTRFAAGDVARVAALDAEAALAVRRDPPPPPGAGVLVEEGLVRRVVDPDPGNPVGGAPLWLLGPRVTALLDELPGPPFELATALQRAIDAGVRVTALPIGPTRDLTTPFDVLERNFPYLAALPR
jgi:CTP:molybdopterin cytidylyltransferase MocA